MLWWPSSSGEQTSHSPGAIRSLGLSGETCGPLGPPSAREEQGGISRCTPLAAGLQRRLSPTS